MSADPRFPRDDWDKIEAELREARRRLDELERLTGSQRNGSSDKIARQLAYQASLKIHNDTGQNNTFSNLASDGTWRYFSTGTGQPGATEVTVDCPTGKMLVGAAIGEASITPPMGYCITEISIRATDANGVSLQVGTVGAFARRYTNIREGLSLRTNDAIISIPDRLVNPGPYRVRLVIGFWGAAGNLGTMTVAVSQPSITVQIIGDGVPA